MKLALDLVLVAGVLGAWLAVGAFFRLHTPFEKLHAVTFLNVVTGGMLVLAAFLNDGLTSRALKCAFIWIAALAIGALLSHVTGRALHLREGERR